jgi:hypothetical protein
VPGLFLAMPLMAAIKAVCSHVPDLVPWANLMSTREALDREESARKTSESIFLGDKELAEGLRQAWPREPFVDQ